MSKVTATLLHKVVELKQMCRERGLKVSGVKAQLIERLNNPTESDKKGTRKKKSTASGTQPRKAKRYRRWQDSVDVWDFDDGCDEYGNPADEPQPAIVSAVMRSSMSQLKRCIADGNDLDARRRWTESEDKFGGYEKSWEWYDFSALQMACDRAQVQMVRLLLESGADPLMKSCNRCDEYPTAREAALKTGRGTEDSRQAVVALIDAVSPLWTALNPKSVKTASNNALRMNKPEMAAIKAAIQKVPVFEPKPKSPRQMPAKRKTVFATKAPRPSRDCGLKQANVSRPHKCTTCRKRFKKEAHLQQHMRDTRHSASKLVADSTTADCLL